MGNIEDHDRAGVHLSRAAHQTTTATPAALTMGIIGHLHIIAFAVLAKKFGPT
ncbi:hypothetical protein OHA25_23055 [Nonomuraea sp. NBC_00507]|uniref:hypothetical protein n=1 Tax=Nonomuraea sp. NBC_00507 TaxID=2976002 RepID=UPI002E193EDE